MSSPPGEASASGESGAPGETSPPAAPPSAAEVASPSYVASLVRTGRIRPKRRLGQNFLVDHRIASRIAQALGLAAAGPGKVGGGPSEAGGGPLEVGGRPLEAGGRPLEAGGRRAGVLEIGAGLGGLTLALAEAGACPVLALEKDPTLAEILEENTHTRPAVAVLLGDVMDLDLRGVAAGAGVSLVAGNLPYAITTPLLLKLLEPPLFWTRAAIMVQLEVALRILAEPGGKDYGALTLAVKAVADASLTLRVSRRCFYPEPGVDSAVLTLARREPVGGLDVAGLSRLSAVVRAAFGQRRKTLANAVAAGLSLTGPAVSREAVGAAARAAGIDPARRGETLSLDEFLALEKALRPVLGAE